MQNDAKFHMALGEIESVREELNRLAGLFLAIGLDKISKELYGGQERLDAAVYSLAELRRNESMKG